MLFTTYCDASEEVSLIEELGSNFDEAVDTNLLWFYWKESSLAAMRTNHHGNFLLRWYYSSACTLSPLLL